MNKTSGVAITAFVVCCGLSGCSEQPPEKNPKSKNSDLNTVIVPQPASPLSASPSDMPGWIDLYREKSLVNVATVDHVVIVTFETQGERDEVYRHYFDQFSSEENFSSFRDNKDIISFVRDGYGIKITLLDSAKNLWSLEYHRQTI